MNLIKTERIEKKVVETEVKIPVFSLELNEEEAEQLYLIMATAACGDASLTYALYYKLKEIYGDTKLTADGNTATKNYVTKHQKCGAWRK